MSRNSRTDVDPFAGYTPVKVRVPVADAVSDDVAQHPPERYRFKKNRPSNDAVAVGKLVLLAAVILLSVSLVAMFAYGFIYERPVEEKAPELTEFADQIRPLASAGERARELTRALVDKVSCARPARQVQSGESRAALSCAMVTNVVLHKKRVDAVEKMVGQGDVGTASVDSGDDEGATDSGTAFAAVDKSVTAKPRVHPEKPKRVVDPHLKRFYNGGRKGRPIRPAAGSEL